MFPGYAPLTTSPVAGVPFDQTVLPPQPQPSQAETFDTAIHLLEIAAYSGDSAGDNLPPWVVTGYTPAGLPFGTVFAGGVTELKLSDRGWIGLPTDATAPNEVYEGRLDDTPEYEQQIPVTPEAGSRGGRTFGTLPLDNLDGELESWPTLYAVDGRQVRVLRASWDPEGEPPAYDDFSLLYAATIANWRADEATLSITLGGARARLDLPAQVSSYAGTGDAQGDATWTDIRMPGAYGRCRNVSPDLIDTTNLVYRVHDRRIRAIGDVRDLGLSLAATSDYADYDALVAADLEAGEYATCLAEGLFRLHSKLSTSLITCDVDGDVDDTGAWAETHAEIAERLLRRGGFGTGELASGTFASAWPAGTAKLWMPSSDATGAPSLSAAMDLLARSVAGYWHEDRRGRIGIGRLVAPASVLSTLQITEDDFRERIDEVDLPRPPRWRQRVTYRRIETVQDRFAGALSEADQNEYRQPWRETSDEDASVATRHPYAAEPAALDSLFDEEADATALAEHIMDLHGPDRRMHRLPVGPLASFVSVGDIVTATYPRGGFGSGKPVAVVGVSDRTGILTVWG